MKNTLVQYTSLIQEIKELNEEIEKMKNKGYRYERDNVTGSNCEFPYQKINYPIEGLMKIDTTVKESILKDRKYKCEKVKIEIEEFISDIEDSLTRRIFKYRYINCFSWQAIAMRIGKIHESYPRKLHDRYLEGLE